MAVKTDHSDSENSDGFVVTDRPEETQSELSPLTAKELECVREWLEATPYDISGGEYRRHAASHLSGTGSWLIASPEYQQWLTSRDHGLLWIKGIPGSGKSVMAAKIIADLRASETNAPVLYFFFRQIIDANHEPSALLRDWMDQLLEHSVVLQRQLYSYVDDCRSLESVSQDDMWKDLKMAFSSLPGKVFCVTDALDEMDQGNDQFLKALANLGLWQPDKVKVLITSRPVPSVEIPLHLIPCLKLRLHEEEVDHDIARFVKYSLENSRIDKRHWPSIIDAVPGRANGLFLYARLAMDAFLEPGADVETALAHLPTDLNVLYTNLLAEHIDRSGVDEKNQCLILQAVTHATRPLRLLEIAEMLGICDDSLNLKARKELVKAACGPLLEILADETVSVIHHSFTEYLKGVTRPNDGQGYPVLESAAAHEQLALACLRYLQSGSLDDFPDEVLQNDNNTTSDIKVAFWQRSPFLKYAAANWYKHAVAAWAVPSEDTKLCAAVAQFLENDYLRRAWRCLDWKHSQLGDSKLDIAAALGLARYVKELVLAGEDVNLPGRRGPLIWAASEGHADVVEELIAAGARLDRTDIADGYSALHAAAIENHHQVVKVLLQSGMSPLTRKGLGLASQHLAHAVPDHGDSALRCTCEKGHLETLEVMLKYVTELKDVHWALAWAACSGNSRLVARLLEYPGVDVNTKVHGDSFLYWACDSVDFETIDILLQAGADAKALSVAETSPLAVDIDYTPPPTAPAIHNCLHGMFGGYKLRDFQENEVMMANLKKLLRSLLAAGLGVNQPDRAGQTVLHRATEYPGVVQLLISAGANAKATDSGKITPLHCVKHPDTVLVLVKGGGADINAKDSTGQTALHYAKTRPPVILKLLELGADCNILDRHGNSPLHSVLKNSSPSTHLDHVTALLRFGADPNVKNLHGLTPLRILEDLGIGKKVADCLIAAGADVNVKDNEGKTALFDAVGRKEHIGQAGVDTVQYLVDAGAAKDARDNKGRSIAHEVIKGLHVNDIGLIIQWLDALSYLGVFDLKAVDNSGNNLLHELCFRVDYTSWECTADSQLFKLLSDAGLDMSQRNHAGQAPLHLLCAIPWRTGGSQLASEITLIHAIRQAEDINGCDTNGNTALHVASVHEPSWCKWLLDAGADPTLRNHDGMTPLHLAARCQQSNSVGMLLRALQDKFGEFPSEKAEVLNARVLPSSHNMYESFNITPLFYACQSGRLESVKMLLDSGADPNIGNVFVACAMMEHENRLWTTGERAPASATVALLPFDTTRPAMPTTSHSSDLFAPFASTRLEEILDMLVEAGIDTSMLHSGRATWQPNPFWKAASLNSSYAYSCLMAIRDKYPTTEKSRRASYRDPLQGLSEFDELVLSSRSQATATAIQQSGWLRPEGVQGQLFRAIIVRREYHLIKQMLDAGCRFLVPGIQNLNYLIAHGLATLFDQIAEAETQARFDEGEWHAFGDATKSGLYFEPRKDEQETSEMEAKAHMRREDNRNMMLQYALERALPNMEIVQLLVDKYAVNINFENSTKNTALHTIARGRHWWQSALALPYLLKSGANVECRNSDGQTPLHLALDKHHGPLGALGAFHKDIAEILVNFGADVNAVDAKGRSCLDLAGYSTVLIDLLVSNGAIVRSSSLFAALESENGPALKKLLEGGADPNGRLPPIENQPRGEDNGSRLAFDQAIILRHEITPIYAIASKHAFPEDAVTGRCLQLLLQHGADMYAKFRVQLGGYRYEPAYTSEYHRLLGIPQADKDDTEERCVLHELIRLGKLSKCLLNVLEIDGGSLDPKGCTLLHAVCDSWSGPDAVEDMDDDGEATDEDEKKTETTAFQKLLSLGCDIAGYDRSGQSVVHHMVYQAWKRPGELGRVQKSIADVEHLAPDLLSRPNAFGNTPMHYSALLATSSRKSARCSSMSLQDRPAVTDELVDISRLLLRHGASPTGVNQDGNTVLHFMAPNLDFADIVTLFTELVRDHGLDVNARNARGETPLMLFANRTNMLRRFADGHRFSPPLRNEALEEPVLALQAIGADFAVTDAQGNGLLHLAATDEVQLFKAIMERGGLDPMRENDVHQTAIDVAAVHNNNEILALFEKKA